MSSSKIVVNRGDSFSKPLVYKVNGSPINITGYTFYFTVKRLADINSEGDESAVLQAINTIHTDAVNGVTTFVFTAEEMSELKGSYVYDIQVKDLNGKISSTSKATFQVDVDVTRTI